MASFMLLFTNTWKFISENNRKGNCKTSKKGQEKGDKRQVAKTINMVEQRS